MRPVGVVQGKVHPGREEAILRGAGYNEPNVLRQVLLVILQRSSSLARVFAPSGEKLRRDMVVGVPDNFPYEGKLYLRDLVPDGVDVEKPRPEGGFRNALVDHLGDGDF